MSAETFYGPDFNLLSQQDPDIAAVLLSELKPRNIENSPIATAPTIKVGRTAPRRS